MQLLDSVEPRGPARQEAGGGTNGNQGTKGNQAKLIDHGDFNVSNAHN